MADIKGKTSVAAGIAPFSEEDNYETHTDKYGKGGYRSVETLEDRDNIPEKRRKEGMLVGVNEEGTIFKLKDGVSNDDWRELEVGGSSSGGEDLMTIINSLQDRLEQEEIKPTGLHIEKQSDDECSIIFSYDDSSNLSHFILERKNPNTGRWEPYDGENGIVNP